MLIVQYQYTDKHKVDKKKSILQLLGDMVLMYYQILTTDP